MTTAQSIPAVLKKRVREIETLGAFGVGLRTTALDAVKIMRGRMLSCILVLEERMPIGIFTERNIVGLASQGLDLETLRMDEVMTFPVLTCGEEEYVYEAFGRMLTSSIRHLVVVNGHGEALGVITQSNIIKNTGYECFLELKQTRQIMSRDLHTLPAEASVVDVLGLMARQGISCVIVTRGGRPAGIITEGDAAALITNGIDAGRRTLGEVMSEPLITVSRDLPVQESAQVMLKHGVRRLVVVDEQGDSVGLITQSDIILGLESKYIEVYKELIRIKDNELRSTLSALEEKNILLDNILTSSIDMGIVATDTTFRITYSNPVAGEILGLPGELVGNKLMSIDQLQEQIGSRGERVLEHIRSRTALTFTYERESGERGKRFVQGRLSGILDREKRLAGYVLMLTDVTERKLAEETIRFMAYHDILTGLPNRVLLNERLNMELIRSERNRLSFALLVIDLDHFKIVNDTFGHYAGDLLLKALAKRLKQLLRKSDTVARIGGDEFVIMLTEIQKAENAWTIAEKIVNSLEQNVIIEGREVRVTVSLGISLFPDHGSTADLLVQRADSAMYRAKEMNRNNCGSNICLASRP